MNLRLNPFFLLLFSFVLLPYSCSSDLDFNQVNDLKLEPAYVANLVYFDIPANEFITNGSENQFITRSSVDIFSNSIFKNDLVQADLDFEVTNTIARSFTLELILRDANNIALDTISMSIPAYTGVENKITQKEIFKGTRLTTLKKSVKVDIAIRLLAGTPLSEGSLGNLKLRSGLTAYFEL